MMHGQKNIKLCDAKQVCHYKNIKLKLHKNNAAIWFNKICKAKHLTPTYASIKIKGDNSRCQKAAYQQATRTVIESDGTICCLYTTMSS